MLDTQPSGLTAVTCDCCGTMLPNLDTGWGPAQFTTPAAARPAAAAAGWAITTTDLCPACITGGGAEHLIVTMLGGTPIDDEPPPAPAAPEPAPVAPPVEAAVPAPDAPVMLPEEPGLPATTVIDGFTRRRTRWLSNFYEGHPFRWDGTVTTPDGTPAQFTDPGFYPTAEHAYQAAKHPDPNIRARIVALPTPHDAKIAGATPGIRDGWDDWASRAAMVSILHAKFTDPVLRRHLADTGDALLIETNDWCDQRWGQCSCLRKRHATICGSNWLGLALMQVRADLRGDPNDRWVRASFTGHRHLSAADGWLVDELARVATKLATRHDTQVAITGLAVGGDQLWPDAARAAGMALWGYSPGAWQPDRWTPDATAQRTDLIGRLARFMELPGDYHVSRLHERNRFMVRDSDVLVAALDLEAEPGGTLACYRAAVAAGCPIIRIDPRTRTTVFVAGRPRP